MKLAFADAAYWIALVNPNDQWFEAAVAAYEELGPDAYYAPDDSRAGFHKIGLKVRREGVKLRYREGYSVEAGPAAPQDRSAQLTKASIAPVDATAIPVEVTAERKQNALTLRISMKPGSLGLAHTGDRWQGSIDVATQFASEKPEGLSLSNSSRSISISPRSATRRPSAMAWCF